MYQIRINAIEGGGYELQVGCQRFFYGTHTAMMAELNNFLEKPKKTEEQYNRFKSLESNAKANPLRTTLGGTLGGDWAPGRLEPAPLPGFEYREPISGIRLDNINPSTFAGPNNTGAYPTGTMVNRDPGAMRP